MYRPHIDHILMDLCYLLIDLVEEPLEGTFRDKRFEHGKGPSCSPLILLVFRLYIFLCVLDDVRNV